MGPHSGCIVFQKRREQQIGIRLLSVPASRKANSQTSAGGVPSDNHHGIRMIPPGYGNEIGKIILKLSDIVHIASAQWFLPVPSQIRRVHMS